MLVQLYKKLFMKQYLAIGLIAMCSAMLGAFFYSHFLDYKAPVVYEKVIRERVAPCPPPARPVYFKGKETNQIFSDFTYAAEKVTPTVVHIRTIKDYRYIKSNEPFVKEATGSGVIVNENGLIVTNKHLVEYAKTIEVTLYNKKRVTAVLLGSDDLTDLAVLKIKTENPLPTINIGNSDRVKVGEWVLAVGNPFNLTSTVTAGIVSAKGRDLDDKASSSIESYIQCDAAVNKGSSGGALVNTIGELVGINTVIATSSGSFEGYSFAIPINIVRKVITDLADFGSVRRAALGLDMRNLNPEDDKGLNDYDGIRIVNIPSYSSAKKSTLKKGDIIRKVNNRKIGGVAELYERISQSTKGSSITITYERNEEVYQTQTRLGSVLDVEVQNEKEALLGGLFQTLKRDDKKLQITFLSYGVELVKCNDRGLICGQTAMKEGFIITTMNNKPIRTVEELYNKINSKKDGEAIMLSGRYPKHKVDSHYGFAMRR